MKAEEIRQLSVQEIKAKLGETRKELVNLKLKKRTGQLEKPHRIASMRRDIARMETILRIKIKEDLKQAAA